MKKIILFFLIFNSILLFASEIENTVTGDFENEKISLEINRYFDPLYPGDSREFIFLQGKNRINLEQFIAVSNDEILIKNQKLIKKTQIIGFTTAGILSGITLSLIVPSIVFFSLQTTYYKTQTNYESSGYKSWIDYYNANYSTYFIPGLTCIIMATISGVVLIVDLVVTFAMVYNYKTNERLYKDAVERFNDKLKEKYGIIPEIGFNFKDNLNLGFKINL